MEPLPFDLNNLRVFVTVVERHGFTAAADFLGVPKSKVSRLIADLETSLRTRLLQRNSRRLVLTEAGSEFYGHCVALLEQARQAHIAMQHRVGDIMGTVRVSATLSVADRLLTEALPSFLEAYPQVKVAIQVTNREVDLIEERIDIAVRGMKAAPEASDMIQSTICTIRWGLFASPAYLAKVPIRRVEDLAGAEAVMYRSLAEVENSWTLYGRDDAELRQRTTMHVQCDNLAVIKSAALAGAGVCELPLYACRDELAAGTLVHILPDFRPRFGRLVLLFPSRPGITPAALCFADHLRSSILASLQPHEHLDRSI